METFRWLNGTLRPCRIRSCVVPPSCSISGNAARGIPERDEPDAPARHRYQNAQVARFLGSCSDSVPGRCRCQSIRQSPSAQVPRRALTLRGEPSLEGRRRRAGSRVCTPTRELARTPPKSLTRPPKIKASAAEGVHGGLHAGISGASRGSRQTSVLLKNLSGTFHSGAIPQCQPLRAHITCLKCCRTTVKSSIGLAVLYDMPYQNRETACLQQVRLPQRPDHERAGSLSSVALSKAFPGKEMIRGPKTERRQIQRSDAFLFLAVKARAKKNRPKAASYQRGAGFAMWANAPYR